MSTVALVLVLAVLAIGIASAAVVRFLPSLRWQLVALALLVVCFPLGVVLGSGLVMFGMHDDGKIVAVAAVSTLCALGGALVLGRRILAPLERLRTASKLLAAGDLSARASESGPRELLELGASFNEMAANGSSTHAASSSPGRATTSGPRWPRSVEWSKRSRTASPPRPSTCRRSVPRRRSSPSSSRISSSSRRSTPEH